MSASVARPLLDSLQSEVLYDFYPIPQLAFYAFVAAVFYFASLPTARRGAGSLLAYCFSKKIWLSASAILDYQFVVLNRWIVLPLAALVLPVTIEKLIVWLQVSWGLSFSKAPAVNTLYSVALLIAADFGFWLCHVCLHRIPFLWEFHRVHHSANALNIFTTQRIHPVEKILVSLFQGGAIALFVFGTAKAGYVPTEATILVTPVLGMILWAQGIFSHSPLRISYGPLSYLFCSPMMHYAHHSMDPRHYEKNFTHFFPIWDLLWGSFYLPKRGETFAYGLPGKSAVPQALGPSLLRPLHHVFSRPRPGRARA